MDETIRVTCVPEEQRRPRPDPKQLGFGSQFSDHMFLLDYDPDRGWHAPRIGPYRPFELPPSTACFHYGQTVFEGLKAYRNARGGIYLFRWRRNAERLNRSAERMCMPPVDPSLFGEAVRQLVLLDRDWIPDLPGSALYIRPVLLAVDPVIKLRPSTRYLFYIVTSPVGSYYPRGFAPVSIWVSDVDVRATPGGTGEAKTGGNYGASLRAQRRAREKGFDQVLWLDARERRYVEEVGSMNVFFLLDDTLVTPPLAGTILPGVTRDSVLRLARHWGVRVEERRVTIEELLDGAESGRLREMFGVGTAVMVAPVGSLSYRGRQVAVAGGGVGRLAQRLYRHLSALQRGEEEDPFGWVECLHPEPLPDAGKGPP